MSLECAPHWRRPCLARSPPLCTPALQQGMQRQQPVSTSAASCQAQAAHMSSDRAPWTVARYQREVSVQQHTDAVGKSDEVGQPEGHPLPLQLHAVEHDACSNHADDDGQQEFLQHLVAEVGDDAVQAIVPFPARQLQGSGRLQWRWRRQHALQNTPLAHLHPSIRSCAAMSEQTDMQRVTQALTWINSGFGLIGSIRALSPRGPHRANKGRSRTMLGT